MPAIRLVGRGADSLESARRFYFAPNHVVRGLSCGTHKRTFPAKPLGRSLSRFVSTLARDLLSASERLMSGVILVCFGLWGIGVYSRGPKGELSLRAQNLVLFLQLAKGMDDARENFLALIYIERQQREVKAALLLVKTPAAQQE
jgi:hypothetical protein